MTEEQEKNVPEVTENNLNQFLYTDGVKVEIDGQLLSHLIKLADMVIDNQTEKYFQDRFKYVNTKTGKKVKDVKEADLQEGKVAKIVDMEATFSAEPKLYRTPLAMEFLNVSLILNGIHLNNINEGVAKHYTEFMAQQPAPQEVETTEEVAQEA